MKHLFLQKGVGYGNGGTLGKIPKLYPDYRGVCLSSVAGTTEADTLVQENCYIRLACYGGESGLPSAVLLAGLFPFLFSPSSTALIVPTGKRGMKEA